MKKIALLIGISNYESEFENLPSAIKDVKAIYKILEDPQIGQFDKEDILILIPESEKDIQIETGKLSQQKIETITDGLSEQEIQAEIYELFKNRNEDDLLLLYFSGHAFINSNGNLFFAANDTKKYEYGGEIIESTAIPASFIRETMNNSKSENKIVILDCCFSGAFNSENITNSTVNIEAELGSTGTAIFTSSNSIDYPFKEDKELSIYTNILIERIKSGVADSNKDGWIVLEELHNHVKEEVLKSYPNMIPQFDSKLKENIIKLFKVNSQSIEENHISQAFHLSQVELQTERGIDYTILRDYLAEENWSKADIETRKVIRKAADKKEDEYLIEEDISQISCVDLSTIDNLWSIASNGLFGFNAQKEICQQLIQKIDYETECELGNKLGWRVNNSWLIHSQLIFSLNSPKGHLPCLGISLVRSPGVFRGFQRIPIFTNVLQRFMECKSGCNFSIYG